MGECAMDPINRNIFLNGDNIYLRPIEKDDLETLRSFINDPEIRKLAGIVTPETELMSQEFYNKTNDDSSRIWFVVVLKENDQIIGEAGLLRMFPSWRTTDLTIIIGDKSEWGKGYGEEATILLMDYAFGYLNFHRISIGVVGFNERAIKFYEKIGFKKEGKQRDGYYYNHQYHDFVMMSILDNEFREKHLNSTIENT